VATAGGPSFDGPEANTVFPLMLTATVHGGGDAATTQHGATMTVGPNGTTALTINNQLLAVTGTAVNNVGSSFSSGSSVLPNGNRIGINWVDLDYTRYGFWDISEPIQPEQAVRFTNGAAFAAGYITPPNEIPVSGTATYAGKVTGQYWYPYDYYEYLFGDVQLTADFGASSVAGSMTNMFITSSDVTINGPLNDVGFNATFDRAHNLFTGTTFVTSMPNSNASFAADASGAISGRFFGPSAREVGAVFTLQDSTRRLIGSFGARQ
jgi:hypothetical protein